MSTTVDPIYALLAAKSYVDLTNPNNRIDALPSGVTRLPGALGYFSDKTSGFEASAFLYNGQVVISIAGTRFGAADLATDAQLAIGIPESQIVQAAAFYERVKQVYGSTVVFTGHSLGGGLAALMGVFFNQQAITFDPAPFRLSATQSTAHLVANYLNSHGYGADSNLATFTTTEVPAVTQLSGMVATVALIPVVGVQLAAALALRSYPTVIRGESNVIAVATAGEILSAGVGSLSASLLDQLRIKNGPVQVVEHGGAGSLGGGLSEASSFHSMNLLAALMIEPALSTLSQQLPNLTKLLLDPSLFSRDPLAPSADIFVKLLNGQYSTGTGHSLNKFATDLLLLVGNSGVAQTATGISDALTVVAMEYYYYKDPTSATTAFTSASGAINFTYSDIGIGNGWRSQTRLRDAISAMLTPTERVQFGSDIYGQNAWHIQSGASPMSWIESTPTNDAAIGGSGNDEMSSGTGSDVLIGGGGSDLLDGGSGSDILIGGDGNDDLVGSSGSDQLWGGAGNDTYYFDAGSGSDVITDADGLGKLMFGTQQITGALQAGPNSWITDPAAPGEHFKFSLTSDGLNLVIGRTGSSDTITVLNWQPGQLGIDLSTTPINTPPPNPYTGDYGKLLAPDGVTFLFDAQGNYRVDAAQPAGVQPDDISGTALGDTINGGDGNNALSGFAGDDTINGGINDDLIMGGLGRDTLNGGAGRDYIYGSGSGFMSKPTRTDQAGPVATGQEWSRGLGWVAFDAGTDAHGPVYGILGADISTLAADTGNIIDGGAGDDLIRSGSGDDVVHGGTENDDIQGLAGADTLYGDAGNDKIWGDGVIGTGYIEYTPPSQQGNDVIDGGAGDDQLVGQGGDDTLFGGTGDDQLWGDQALTGDAVKDDTPASVHGNDYLDGGDGNDTLVGGGRDDILIGGIGNDILMGDGDPTTLTAPYHGKDLLDGGDGTDSLEGGGNDDTLLGGAGNDTLQGDSWVAGQSGTIRGVDYLDGGAGDDTLTGGALGDTLIGGTGNDTLIGDGLVSVVAGADQGDDYLDGGDGNDTLNGGGGADTLIGGSGDDTLYGESADTPENVQGNDYLDGGAGIDVLNGGGGSDTLIGGDGNDSLYGDSTDTPVAKLGDDYLDGGSGDDTLVGGGGADTLIGGDGADTLFGDSTDTPAAAQLGDYLDGGAGNDTLSGGGGDDTLIGGTGNDTLFGGTGNDTMEGDAGDDYIAADEGNDTVSGGDGNDTLYGGDGNDTLIGGAGADVLSGDAGNDTYQFSAADLLPVNGLIDSIFDNQGSDTLAFQDGFSFADAILTADASGSGLVLTSASSGASLDIANLLAGASSVRQIQFSDGQSVSTAKLFGQKYTNLVNVYDQNASSYLLGGLQNDTIFGAGANATLSGGLGNDHLIGSSAQSTTFLFNRGDGADTLGDTSSQSADGSGPTNTLVFSDIAVSDLKIQDTIDQYGRDTATLVVANGGGSMQLSTFSAADVIGTRTLDSIQFSDGSTKTWTQVVATVGIDITGTSAGVATTVNGTSANDRIIGGTDNETINAGAGDDRIDGGVGNDTLDGGAGSDTYVFKVGSGQDTINNTDTAAGKIDRLEIDAALSPTQVGLFRYDDSLVVRVLGGTDLVVVNNYFAGAGLDQVHFADGTTYTPANTVLSPLSSQITTGSDTIFGSQLNDVIDALAGDDAVHAGRGDDTVLGNDGNDTLYGDAGNDTLDGGRGSDTLFGGDGADILIGGTVETDLLYGEAGNDQLTGNGTLDGGDGNDTLTAGGAAGTQLLGGNGDDQLTGTTNSENLDGGAGNDTLYAGGGGGDYLTGGTGNDTYVVVRGDNYFLYQNDTGVGRLDTLRFGANILPGQVVFSGDKFGNLIVTVPANGSFAASTITLVGFLLDDAATNKIDQIVFDSDPATVWTTSQIEALAMAPSNNNQYIRGTLGDDTLSGLGGDDYIYGRDGNDTLLGGDGTDVLDGGTGNDILSGGAGNGDVMVGGAGSDTYVYNLGDGSDTVLGTRDSAPTSIDTVQFGSGILPGNVTVTRPLFSNDLKLTVYDPVTGALSGSIYVVDGFNDTYGSDIIDQVTFAGAPGSVWSRTDLQLLTLTGANANDSITGFSTNDVIRGNGGNDRLDGGAGNDDLSGGTGNDQIIGGLGDDTFHFGHGQGYDEILDTSGVNRIVLDAGIAPADVSFVRTSSATPLADGIFLPTRSSDALALVLNGTGEQLWVGNFFGGQSPRPISQVVFADGTTWNSTAIDAHTVNQAGTANTMTGTAGNDTFTVDHPNDVVTEAANAGTDLINSSITYTLPVNIENLTLTGVLNISGTGNALQNTIVGNAGDNYLWGGFIAGGGGAPDGVDTLTGGAGNDTYQVDKSASSNYFDDIIVEAVNGGYDTLIADTYSAIMPANVEAMTVYDTRFAGTYTPIAQQITGNALDNYIDASLHNTYGNGYTLDGGAGADTMIGPTGTSFTNPVTDRTVRYIVDNVGDIAIGNSNVTDVVVSSVSYTIGTGIDTLELSGSAAISGTGNSLNNTINGLLNTSANVLAGGTGNDTYIVGAGDTVIENAGEGTDTLQSASTYTLGNNVENLTLTGTGIANGTGNALDNVLVGNSAANVLIGGAGNDTLGGRGGVDTYVFSAGFGTDTIQDTATGSTQDGAIDRISFDATISQANVAVQISPANAADLLISVSGTSDNITVKNFFAAGSAQDRIEQVQFADGTVWQVADILAQVNSIVGTAGADVLNAAASGSILKGLAGNDTLNGGAGNDWLDGGTGADLMTGGGGDDTYIVDDPGDVVTEAPGAGTDGVYSSIAYALTSDVENLTLTGTGAINGAGNALDNVITGNGSANALSGGAGNDSLYGGAGNDAMSGGDGSDVYYVDSTGDSIVEGAGLVGDVDSALVDIDNYVLAANVENLQLNGNAAVITGSGNAGDNSISAVGTTQNNTLYGLAGNDTLDGGLGLDTLVGGTGNDDYIIDSTDGFIDTIVENANEGYDWVDIQNTLVATYVAPTNVEGVISFGVGNNLTGNTLDNELDGDDGNNVLDGSSGADALYGYLGNDTYVVDNAGDTVFENAGEGTDTVQSSISYALGANLENLTLTGSANITATGNAVANTVTGNSGNNILDGGAGTDAMAGGLGNDTYIVDVAGDTVTEGASAGTDTVQSAITYTLGSNVENLTLTATTAINGTGNTLDNVLIGGSGNNTLTGLAGNDTLDGGSAGTDVLLGGTGNDTYVVNRTTGITITENASEGTDLVQASVTYALGTNMENLTLTGSTAINGTGNTLANVITGNSANNALDGGTGADTLIGGAGNDTYAVDNTADIVTENASEGTDLVNASVTYTLGSNVENLTLAGTTALNGTGNTLDNVLIGNTGNNTLTGLAGNDTLDAGTAGTDVLVGGLGNDTYVIGRTTGITITENASEGTDLVSASVTYTLGTNLENLTLTGTSAINGTGNTVANVITGNSGVNTLDGGTGVDTLIGGAGNDIYTVDNTGDIVTENASEGTDLVNASATYTIGNNVENLTLSGSTALNGTGNTLDNVLTGNTGNNTLTGLAGNDTLDAGTAGTDVLVGGLGNDIYVVGRTTGITITENAIEGTDLVNASVAYTLGTNLENLTLTGSTAINGTGNTADNVLTGNSGNNTLTGLAGNDTLDGGTAGTDVMVGGTGNDTYIVNRTTGLTLTEAANEGIDSVSASVTQTLGANIEALFLTGSTAINGTGNTLANLLRGNTGINTLAGGGGTDILEGDASNDILSNTSGNTLLDGGAGNDALTGAANNDLLIGGTGNDTLTTGQGADIIAFNKGDGVDTVAASTTADNTLALGGGALYSDLVFQKSGTNLILKIGATDQITFTGYYTGSNRSVSSLQVVIEGTSDYNAGSGNAMNNKKVETFNFGGLVAAFDAALVANPSLTSWSLTNALATQYLTGSDTAALGGDLAYQYARNGNLSNISFTPALALLGAAGFGTAAQGLQALASLQDATPRLS